MAVVLGCFTARTTSNNAGSLAIYTRVLGGLVVAFLPLSGLWARKVHCPRTARPKNKKRASSTGRLRRAGGGRLRDDLFDGEVASVTVAGKDTKKQSCYDGCRERAYFVFLLRSCGCCFFAGHTRGATRRYKFRRPSPGPSRGDASEVLVTDTTATDDQVEGCLDTQRSPGCRKEEESGRRNGLRIWWEGRGRRGGAARVMYTQRSGSRPGDQMAGKMGYHQGRMGIIDGAAQQEGPGGV
ncbi:hypothetical protein GQ53DRAFT_741922 [Thozetella sp. PMI_491]|nr:hypothetical protein GQ53DRAFT_741922 [Thozetella sp. PMI_491]